MLQAVRYAVDDLLTYPRYCQHEEENTREEHYPERSPPRNVHVQANGVGELGIERHARCQCDGIVCIKPHHQSGNRGGEAGRENDAIDGHSCLGEDLRVYDDDVRHRQKSREAAENLLPQIRLVLGKPEVTREQSFSSKAQFSMGSYWAFHPTREMLPALVLASSESWEFGVAHAAELFHDR